MKTRVSNSFGKMEDETKGKTFSSPIGVCFVGLVCAKVLHLIDSVRTLLSCRLDDLSTDRLKPPVICNNYCSCFCRERHQDGIKLLKKVIVVFCCRYRKFAVPP